MFLNAFALCTSASDLEENIWMKMRIGASYHKAAIPVTCGPNQDTKARICTWSRVAEANTTRDVARIECIQHEYSVFSIHTFIVWGLKIYLVIGLYTMASVEARYECLMTALSLSEKSPSRLNWHGRLMIRFNFQFAACR